MKAVILAAGKGSRLKPYTDTTPKPLIKIKDKEILSYIIDSLPKDVEEILIIVKHLDHKIKDFINTNYKDKNIICINQETPEGTLGALVHAKDYLQKENKFLVLNGDDIFSKEDIKKMTKQNFAIGIKKDKIESGYLIIQKDKNFFLKSFKTPTSKELKEKQFIGTGMYILNKNFWKYAPKDFTEKKEYGIPTIFREIIKKEKVKTVINNSYLKNNTIEDIKNNEKYIDLYN